MAFRENGNERFGEHWLTKVDSKGGFLSLTAWIRTDTEVSEMPLAQKAASLSLTNFHAVPNVPHWDTYNPTSAKVFNFEEQGSTNSSMIADSQRLDSYVSSHCPPVFSSHCSIPLLSTAFEFASISPPIIQLEPATLTDDILVDRVQECCRAGGTASSAPDQRMKGDTTLHTVFSDSISLVCNWYRSDSSTKKQNFYLKNAGKHLNSLI